MRIYHIIDSLSWKWFDGQMLILTGEVLREASLHNCLENCVGKLPKAYFHMALKWTKVCFCVLLWSLHWDTGTLLCSYCFQDFFKLYSIKKQTCLLLWMVAVGPPRVSLQSFQCWSTIFFCGSFLVLMAKEETRAHSEQKLSTYQEKAS
jgi:hypothetical protein